MPKVDAPIPSPATGKVSDKSLLKAFKARQEDALIDECPQLKKLREQCAEKLTEAYELHVQIAEKESKVNHLHERLFVVKRRLGAIELSG